MSASPNLRLPYLDANQNQKSVTHNAALRMLDALVQLQVQSSALGAPPAAPADGQCWIVASGGTGAWTGKDLNVAAWQDGAWAFYAPNRGTLAFDAAQNALLLWTGAAWVPLFSLLTQLRVAGLGIGTAPDGVNRLAVKSEAALLTWDDVTPGAGNMRVSLNRKAAANDAAFIFEDNYAARALVGLLGDDDFVLKVSPDGSTFHEGLRIEGGTGLATFPNGLTIPNRTTFVDILGAVNQEIGSAFTRVNVDTVNADTGGNWDNTNFWYTCPRSGIYSIAATLRVYDGAPAGAQYGLGVYTAEQDGPWFLWHAVIAQRSTYPYARLSYQNKGDQLRLYAYSDATGNATTSTGKGVKISVAGLQIVLVSDA